MDFVHDQMADGRAFRILAVIDQWSRESVCLEANFCLTGRCVGKALDAAAATPGLPRAIIVDNGTEFTSQALDDWAYRREVKLDYTRLGKHTDNGLIESFNHSTIQPFNHSTIQPFNHSTIQPFNHSTIQPFNHSTIQPFNHSTIQPFNHSTGDCATNS
jgi:transposase InsO family protein